MAKTQKYDEFGDELFAKLEPIRHIESPTNPPVDSKKSEDLTVIIGGEEHVLSNYCEMYINMIIESVNNDLSCDFLEGKSVISMDIVVQEILEHLKKRAFEINPEEYIHCIPVELQSAICEVSDKDELILRLNQLRPYLHIIEEEICSKLTTSSHT